MTSSIQSGLDGWNNCKFEAYAKLLRLKSGRQIQEASDFTDISGEQAENSGLESTDSVDVNVWETSHLTLKKDLMIKAQGEPDHHPSILCTLKIVEQRYVGRRQF